MSLLPYPLAFLEQLLCNLHLTLDDLLDPLLVLLHLVTLHLQRQDGLVVFTDLSQYGDWWGWDARRGVGVLLSEITRREVGLQVWKDERLHTGATAVIIFCVPFLADLLCTRIRGMETSIPSPPPSPNG